MAKLPRYTAKVPPPRGAADVRATDIGALTRTGRAAGLRGLAAAGGAISRGAKTLLKIHQDRQAIDAQIQHDKVSSNMGEYDRELIASMNESSVESAGQRNVLHKSLMAKRSKYRDELIRTTVDNHKAREALKLGQVRDSDTVSTRIYSRLNSQWDDYQVSTNLEIADSFIADGNEEAAIERYKFMLEHRQLTPKEANSRINAVPGRVARALRDSAEVEAQGILRKAGLSAAEAYVASLSPDVVNLIDQAKIIESLGRIDKVDEIQTGIEMEANNKVAVQELFGKLNDVKTWPTLKEIEDDPSLDGYEGEAWSKIILALPDAKKIETDWKKAIDFEMKLFDRWDGLDKSVDRTGKEPIESAVLLETEIATARYVDKIIDDKTMAEYVRRLGMDVPERDRSSLRSAFDIIKKEERAFGQKLWPLTLIDTRVMTKGEAARVAAARSALLDWYQEQKTKKKEIGLPEMLKKTLHLSVAERKEPVAFDPEGTDYDYRTAGEAGLEPNKAGHWGSLDPRTGMVLKGRSHPTWDLMVKEEKKLGNKIVKRGGRYYSVKKEPSLETKRPGFLGRKESEFPAGFPPMKEPKTKTEFINALRRLNETDTKRAREYYNKYIDKFW